MKMQAAAELSSTLADLVDDALALLKDFRHGAFGAPLSDDPLPSLLDQCRALVAEADARGPEPVRVLQHVACSGGTIMSKCLAAMPNTVLLSEVDPLSVNHMQSTQVAMFQPTDLIKQLRYSRLEESPEIYADMFLGALQALHRHLTAQGRHLVIRAHSHSQFFRPVDPVGRATVPDVIRRQHPILSVVTLRHPLDSWLSLNHLAWVQFKPATLEEYSRRYQLFMDSNVGLPTVRYEDFVADPETVLEQLCSLLGLPYLAGAPSLIGAIRVSGDSGRSDSAIAPRPRREIPPPVQAELGTSPAYRRLCEKLGYDPTPP